jgi:hypothetical protein
VKRNDQDEPSLRRILATNVVRWGGETTAWDLARTDGWRMRGPSHHDRGLCAGDIEHDTCTMWWLCKGCGLVGPYSIVDHRPRVGPEGDR